MENLLRYVQTRLRQSYWCRYVLVAAVLYGARRSLDAQPPTAMLFRLVAPRDERSYDDVTSSELRRLGVRRPIRTAELERLPAPRNQRTVATNFASGPSGSSNSLPDLSSPDVSPPSIALPDPEPTPAIRAPAERLTPIEPLAPFEPPSTQPRRGAASEELSPPPESLRASAHDKRLPSWWDERVHQPLRPSAVSVPVSLDSLLTATLNYSHYVRVIKDIPLIRETSVIEADADFDWISFVESRWNDVSDPVGNLLTTGNQLGGQTLTQDRFRDEHLTARGGVRRRNPLGGELEMAQEIGRQRTNSQFFSPPLQGTSRITVNYTQPLLRGAGVCYNRSLTVLAEIDAAAGQDQLSQELQEHLIQVTNAYWQLYFNRGRLLQKRRLLAQAQAILDQLEQRRELDVLRSQIVRARSAVESRAAEIARAETEIRNTESLIRSLVNDPSLGNSRDHELVPQDQPSVVPREFDQVTSIETALQHRPEISLAVKQIKSASVRLNMTKNELLPALNVILDTYVSGLRDDYNVGEAWRDQFRLGEPTYSAGLQYELPLGNRAAKARYQRRRLELRQLEADLKTTMERLRQEVEVAVAEVTTTYQEMEANHRSMEAVAVESDYIYDRWQLLPGSDRSASFLLDDLLLAQERLNAAELAFLQAQVSFNVTQMLYLRTTGTLLQSERISIERFCECYLPNLQLRRPQTDSQREITLPADDAPAYDDPDRRALQPMNLRR